MPMKTTDLPGRKTDPPSRGSWSRPSEIARHKVSDVASASARLLERKRPGRVDRAYAGLLPSWALAG